MHYYLYQITNLVNNKIYVGVHKTKSLDDGYMGSGKVIKQAIEKHGLENFRKDILEFFGTAEDMYAREKEVVDEEFLLREDVYNLRRGGHGGFDFINEQCLVNQELVQKRKIGALKGNKTQYEKKIGLHIGDVKKRILINEKVNLKNKVLQKGCFFNDEIRKESCKKAQSREAKLKRKQTLEKIKHQCGEKNSQHGKMWIYNVETLESIRIGKEELIPEGWSKGRKIKMYNLENL